MLMFELSAFRLRPSGFGATSLPLGFGATSRFWYSILKLSAYVALQLRRDSLRPSLSGSPSRSPKGEGWWGKQDSNLRRHSQRIYSPPPLPLGTFPRPWPTRR